MNKGEIIWSPESLDDLDEIHAYVAQDSFANADKLISAIEARCQILLVQPFMGKMTEPPEIRVREIKEGKYRIIYHTMSLPDVEIVRVIHSARIFY